MPSVLELLEDYRHQRITQDYFSQELQRYLHAAEQRLQHLQTLQVPADDEALWQNMLKPGLHLMTRCLISAVKESLEYAQSRNRSLLSGIVALLKQMEQMGQLLESRLDGASAMTRQYLRSHLQLDDLNIQVDQWGRGQAQEQISFLDLD